MNFLNRMFSRAPHAINVDEVLVLPTEPVDVVPTSPKHIKMAGQPLAIHNLGESDGYFGAIQDDYAPDLQRFCRENLTRDSVVFDIGANIGLTSCIFNQHAGRVYAFEPNPAVFPLLQKNVETNRLQNVSVHNMAIGATTGTTHFAGESAFGYMTKDVAAPAVQIDTVDRLVSEFGLDRLDLLKIDVEGFEPDVLAGARSTIKRFNPTIYMELNAWCILFNARLNPCDFVESLVRDFGEVLVMRANGVPEPAPDSTNLVFQNFFKYGSVNDLILRHPRFE